MRYRRVRQLYDTTLEMMRRRLPKKKGHFDYAAERRRRRNPDMRRPARRQSFKRYWREVRLKTWVGGDPLHPQHPRRTRRAWVRAWYKMDKQGARHDRQRAAS